MARILLQVIEEMMIQQCPRQGVIGELAYFLIGECGLVQEIKDVMDSNDICTPTSKEDSSYLTLVKFLQQFLPKGLHKTIDDKKVIFPH